ncbi:uncharacterized protein L203_103444 [Cryptococcus depauperatus CBS 7841]|uniref:ubiquitinyl hydrolase 1 n=1 Tax=Cryptococcus depauperatus CBS 7841 TaxID=1295531 RepID=A0AAJ8M1N4_9TREE
MRKRHSRQPKKHKTLQGSPQGTTANHSAASVAAATEPFDYTEVPEDIGIESDGESSASLYTYSPSCQAYQAATPTHSTLPYSLNKVWIIFLTLASQLYISICDMTLGIGKWFDSNKEMVEEERLRLIRKEDKSVKVKRRRQKVDSLNVATREYFPGMVNLSGTLCYMNSVLQSVASVPSLIDHLEKVISLAVEADMPTHVTDALLDIVCELNTPHKRPPSALRPHNLLQALYPLPAIRRLLSTHEQQDAHELFLVLVEAISDEVIRVAAEVVRARGLGELLSIHGYICDKNEKKNVSSIRGDSEGSRKRDKVRGVLQPWEGLLARRRVCQQCGWSEAVRMDTLSGMELSVPLHGETTLDACITEYLAPEVLTDVTCEMCSLKATLQCYTSEVERLSSAPNQSSRPRSSLNDGQISKSSFSILENSTSSPLQTSQMTTSRKKRARDARRAETRLREMLESNTISHFGESTLTPLPSSDSFAPIPVKWQTARTTSIRQGVVTRPPQSLRLHFIRSEFTMYGTVQKKVASVAFPMILDFTRFVANGVWEEREGIKSMLMAAAFEKEQLPSGRRVLYRLESAILHYGFTHSSGHFICIRRKPLMSLRKDETQDIPVYRPMRITKSCPDGCCCQDCAYFGQVRNFEANTPGKGWLRISDADVEEVGEEALHEARGAVVMLFYERIDEYKENKLVKKTLNPVIENDKEG